MPADGLPPHRRPLRTARCRRRADTGLLLPLIRIFPFMLRTVRYAVLLLISQQSRLYHHPRGMPTASGRLSLLPDGIVVEPSPIQSLAADCPFFIRRIFKAFASEPVSSLCCSPATLGCSGNSMGYHAHITASRNRFDSSSEFLHMPSETALYRPP